MAIYVIAYVLMMTREVPAQSSPGVKAFSSSSRFAEIYVEDLNGTHWFYPAPTFANFVFWPIDYVLDRLNPDQVGVPAGEKRQVEVPVDVESKGVSR